MHQDTPLSSEQEFQAPRANSHWKVILAIICLFLVGVILLLALQNYQLSQRVIRLESSIENSDEPLTTTASPLKTVEQKEVAVGGTEYKGGQTYTNTDLGFRVTFPSDWPELQSEVFDDQRTVGFYLPLETKVGDSSQAFVFSIGLRNSDETTQVEDVISLTTDKKKYVFIPALDVGINPNTADFENFQKIWGSNPLPVIQANFEVLY